MSADAPYADLEKIRVDKLKRAVKAIKVFGDPHADDGTVKNDVRVRGQLATNAFLTDLALSHGHNADVDSWLLASDIGEDLVLGWLYRRLDELGVSRGQVWQ